MYLRGYTTPDEGPLSWSSVNKGIKRASVSDFVEHAKDFYNRDNQGALERPGFLQGLGFVTDSPIFDNPGGFYRPLTNEEDIALRARAQQAIEAGRPMTISEMYGKPQQLFTTLQGEQPMDGVVADAGKSMWEYFKPMIPWFIVTNLITAIVIWKLAGGFCGVRMFTK